MFAFINKIFRQPMTLVLFVMSILCFFLFLFRMMYTQSAVFIFLNWNLFLAFIPWAFTTILVYRPQVPYHRWYILVLLAVWLLFFPNAPYILTDLFHLRNDLNMPIWFDLTMILSFAWTGLMFGFVSLFNIEKYLSGYLPKWGIRILAVFLLFAGSFGIYLGRYLRWNSWDLIHEPLTLISDITDNIRNPFTHPRAWGMTILMGLLLNMFYWSLKAIQHKREINL